MIKKVTLIALVLMSINLVFAQSMVKDINPTTSSSPNEFAALGYDLYFSADDGTNGRELWKSDGTATGTVMVKNIRSSSGSSNPRYLKAFNGKVYFSADDGTGEALWMSDGTASGTEKIIKGTIVSTKETFHEMNGMLYFCFNDGSSDYALWKTDGTVSGTELVKDISPSANSVIYSIIHINNTLYFLGRPTSGAGAIYQLWISDGTTSGTTQLKAGLEYTDELVVNNGALYFPNGTNKSELWTSDGTIAGTVIVQSMSASDPIMYLTSFNNNLFFSADDGVNGRELWTSDGTPSGTNMVTDIYSGVTGSAPRYLTVFNGLLYFSANDGVVGHELWASDGTAVGTVLLKDINTGSANGGPNYFTEVNGKLYFSATKTGFGAELWETDGTTGGTQMTKDIRVGTTGSNPSNLIDVDGTLYFSADDGVGGGYGGSNVELWSLEPCTAYPPQLMSIYNAHTDYNAACSEDSIVLFVASGTLNGGTVWEWYTDGCGVTSIGSGDSITVAPINTGSTNTTISYYARTEGGCIGSTGNDCQKIDITVLPLPILHLVADDSTICFQKNAKLTVSGADYYNWDNGLGSGSPKTVYPTADSTFSVIGRTSRSFPNTNGYSTSSVYCYSKRDSLKIIVNPLPNVNAGADRTVCIKSRITLEGSGAETYTWNGGKQNGVPFLLYYPATITYTVTGTDSNGCIAKDEVDITVTADEAPNVNLSADAYSVCQTGSVTLTASGNSSLYTWSHSLGGGATKTVSPTATTTYSVTGTGTNGCTNTASKTIVYSAAYPVFTIAAEKDSVCEGTYAKLSVVGANESSFSWSWPYSGESGRSMWTIQNSTTTYTATAYNGCTTIDSITIVTNLKPTIAVTADTTYLCGGGSATLTATGDAATYLWSEDLSTDPTLVVTPTATKTYPVQGISIHGCTSIASIKIYAASAPLVFSITADQDTLCSGDSTKIMISNTTGATVTWNNNQSNLAIQTVTPPTTTTYIATVSNGCLKKDSITIYVKQSPNANIGPDTLFVCDQQALAFGIDTTGQNISSYYVANFSNTVNNDSLFFIYDMYNPISAIYSEVVGMNGCISKDRVLLEDNEIKNMSLAYPSLNDPSMSFSIANMPSNVDFWYWDFGDGDTLSGNANPVHEYDENGTYEACLIAVNECGADTSCITFGIYNASGVGVKKQSFLSEVKAYPNPSEGEYIIEGLNEATLVVVSNSLGQIISKEEVTTNTSKIDLRNHAKGVYLLQLSTSNAERTIRLIKL